MHGFKEILLAVNDYIYKGRKLHVQFQGRLHDGHNVLEWLMEKDNVLPRLNSRVLSGPTKTLDLSENIGQSGVCFSRSESQRVLLWYSKMKE